MDSKYLEEIKAREQAATKGPWKNGIGYDEDTRKKWICGLLTTRGKFEQENANADFIAHSRTDIPALIEQHEQDQKQISTLKKALELAGNVLSEKDGNSMEVNSARYLIDSESWIEYLMRKSQEQEGKK